MAYINRKELIENLEKFAPEHLTPLIKNLIEKQPTAEVVEVVRCKDCRFVELMSDGKTYACIRQSAYKKPTDFCSYGERRDT